MPVGGDGLWGLAREVKHHGSDFCVIFGFFLLGFFVCGFFSTQKQKLKSVFCQPSLPCDSADGN